MKPRALIGPVLGALIIAAWLGCLIYSVRFHRWTPWGIAITPVLMALQCWLNVGLFIVAHDCMHGSLAPGFPRVNRALGQTCLALYAGFSFDRMRSKHMLHHVHSGTALDPDFSAAHPTRFWPWFISFFRTYFRWSELGLIILLFAGYLLLLHANPVDLLLFWGVPALLSAAQLFYFGTFLPHRHDEGHFSDHHNARSNEYSWLLSLLTCFHFGYHREHHREPSVPWWHLPSTRAVSPQE